LDGTILETCRPIPSHGMGLFHATQSPSQETFIIGSFSTSLTLNACLLEKRKTCPGKPTEGIEGSRFHRRLQILDEGTGWIVFIRRELFFCITIVLFKTFLRTTSVLYDNTF
jgi:hypothetical protein